MSPKHHRHKLLLDEGVFPRQSLLRINQRYDVKHITHEFHFDGLKDEDVYKVAEKQYRIIVTFNTRDFKKLAERSGQSGVIGVSQNMTPDQLDKKLNALLSTNPARYFYGKYTALKFGRIRFG